MNLNDPTFECKAVNEVRSDAFYRKVFENACTALAVVDEDLRIIKVNRQFESLSGYLSEEVEGIKSWGDFVTKTGLPNEYILHGKDGIDCDVWLKEGSIENYLILSFTDISIHKKTQRELEQLTRTDYLTGLYNHGEFYKNLNQEVAKQNRYGGDLSLVMMDLDDFKSFNDRFGHRRGDRVLHSMGNCIMENIRETDSGYRYGGEEFAILLPETPMESAYNLADRIRKEFSSVGVPDCCTVSCGITQYVKEELVNEFVDRADKLMYIAKKEKNQCVGDL
ncbi:MAG: sensor domain-containing diguanylate cyclase [Candidatus Woesearchaeota archaeon]